jgi:hypothetical protein
MSEAPDIFLEMTITKVERILREGTIAVNVPVRDVADRIVRLVIEGQRPGTIMKEVRPGVMELSPE